MAYNYEVRFNLDDCIKKLGLEEQGRVQQFVTNEVLEMGNQLIPFDTGALRDSGHIENGTEIVWATPYARRWYYANTPGGLDQNIVFQNGRTSYWVHKSLQNGGLKRIEDGARRLVSR